VLRRASRRKKASTAPSDRAIPMRRSAEDRRKVDAAPTMILRQIIRPLIYHPLVEYIGESSTAKNRFSLGRALACFSDRLAGAVRPGPWTEAMACVTRDCVSSRFGAEIIDEGLNRSRREDGSVPVAAVDRFA